MRVCASLVRFFSELQGQNPIQKPELYDKFKRRLFGLVSEKLVFPNLLLMNADVQLAFSFFDRRLKRTSLVRPCYRHFRPRIMLER